MPQIPTVDFDTDHFPPDQRFEAYRAFLPYYQIALPSGADAAFRCKATASMFGDFIVSQTSLPAIDIMRDEARAQMDHADSLIFLLVVSGAWSGTVGDRDLTVGAGQLVGFDLKRSFAANAEPTHSISIVVARAALVTLLKAEPDIHGHVFEGVSGALLIEHVLALTRHIAAMTQDDIPAVSKATLAQIVAALAKRTGAADADAGTSAVHHAVRRYIDRRLHDLTLTPEKIGEDLAMSRTTLYRRFEAFGGLAAFIQRRRLEAVRTLLLHPEETRSIGELSQTFGFTNQAHFSTAFRRQFGCSPRDLRSKAGFYIQEPGEPDLHDGAARFRAWHRQV